MSPRGGGMVCLKGEVPRWASSEPGLKGLEGLKDYSPLHPCKFTRPLFPSGFPRARE